MTLWGIGPSLVLVGTTMSGVVFILQARFGIALPTGSWLRPLAVAVGICLALFGTYFWIASACLVTRAFASQRLVTSGVYRFSRNPLYAAFIVFLVPGLALFLNNLLLLLASLLMYAVFAARIGKEEAYLADRYGEEYAAYRAAVPRLIPLLHPRH